MATQRTCCSIDGCNRPHKAHTLCSLHYKRLWRTGDPRPELPPVHGGRRSLPRACSVDGCSLRARTLGFCPNHYYRMRTHGSPTAGRIAPGTCETTFYELVKQETDDCIVWPYSLNTNGYAQFTFSDTGLSVGSRRACEIEHGPAPDGMEAAHSCGVRACINRRHLRWATPVENSHDKIGHGTNSKKLTVHDVLEIRRRAPYEPRVALAAEFGITKTHVHAIVKRHVWNGI